MDMQLYNLENNYVKYGSYSFICFESKKCNIKTIKKVVAKRKSSIDYSKYRIQDIKNLVDEGFSLNQIGKQIGEKISTVRKILLYFNLKTKQAQLLDSINKNELIKKLNNGESQKEIAKSYHVYNVGTLTHLIRKCELSSPTQAKVDAIPEVELKEFADKGYSYTQIANHYNVSIKFIKNRMCKLGIKTKMIMAREKYVSEDHIKHCYLDLGMSIKSISEQEGVSAPKIYSILNKQGIKTPIQLLKEKAKPSKNEIIEKMVCLSTKKELAKELGITLIRLKKLLVEYDIKNNLK